MGHSCRDTLVGHSCRTLLGHCCGTLLWDTLVGHSSSSPDTPRTKVVLQGRQFSPSTSIDCFAYESCTTKSPVLSFRRRTNRTLACISRAQRARSPQRVVRAPDKSHSRLHFARSTHAISAEGCARVGQIALSPAFRALDARDLRRGLRAHGTNRTLACISRARHARSPQRVARAWVKSHSRLHFAHSTGTISAEGCAPSLQTSVSYETSSKTHTSKSAKRCLLYTSPSPRDA